MLDFFRLIAFSSKIRVGATIKFPLHVHRKEKSSTSTRVGEFATQIKICRKKRLGKVPTFGKNPRHTLDFSQKF